jgi:uncharacterized membrane protein
VPAATELASPTVPAPSRAPVAFPRDGTEFNRVMALSDGVAAIALTILVLQLALPALPVGKRGADVDLGAILVNLEGPFFAFCLSFVIIALSWYGHHRFIGQLRGLDVALVMWNFWYLFMLVLVPFASALVGTYGSNPGADVIYAVVMALLYFTDFPGMVLARRHDLYRAPPTPALWRARVLLSLIPPALFLLSVPVTVFLGQNGYLCWFAIAPAMVFARRYRARIVAREGAPEASQDPSAA